MHTCAAVAALDYTNRVVAGGYRLSLSKSQEMAYSRLHRHSFYRVILTRGSVARHTVCDYRTYASSSKSWGIRVL